MAGVGMDGLERQIKQLQRELGGKDVELSNVRQELHKHKETLKTVQRDREEEAFNIERLTDRALKAENALSARVAETSKLQLQVDNMRRSMYDADSSRPKGKNTAEQSKIQELQELLRAREEQVEDLQKRCEASSSKQPSPTSETIFPLSSPTSASGSRRRSTSLSSANQVQALERELQQLRKASSSIGDVRLKLSTAEKERDRALNDKMRIEKQMKEEMEVLKTQMEDQGYELAHYKGKGKASPELDKLRKDIKSVEAQRDALQQKVDGLQAQVESLSANTDRMEELQEELAAFRSAPPPQTSVVQPDSSIWEAKVASLEADLARAQETATVPVADNNVAAKQNLKLQREIKTLKLQLDALQSELVERDDELLQARSGVPLPGSPVLSPQADTEIDKAKLQSLEEKVVELEMQLRSSQDLLRAAENAREEGLQRLSAAEADLGSVREQLAASQGELVASQTKTASLEADIAEARSSVRVKEAEILELVAQAKDASEAVTDRATTIRELQGGLAAAVAAQGSAESALAAQRAESQAARTESEARQAALIRRSTELEDEIKQLKSAIADVAAASEKDARDSIAELKDETSRLQAEIDELRPKLDQSIAALDSANARVLHAEQQHADAEALRAQLEDQITELQASFAARASIHDAAKQAQEMGALRGNLADLEGQLATLATQRQQEVELANAIQQERDHKYQAEVSSLRTRGAELEAQVSGLLAVAKTIEETKTASEQKNVGMLHTKIAQLRIERDELRHNLSFAQTEGRFALKAVEADRSTAFAKLEAIQADLDAHKTSLTTAQAEKTDLEAKIADIAAARDLAIQEQVKLEQAHEHSQRETGVQLIELVNHVALRGSELVEAQRQLRENKATIGELEKRIDALQSQRDGEEIEAKDYIGVMDTPGQPQPGEPRSRMKSAQTISDRQSRRRSEIFSVENMHSLQEQVTDLKGRIERREATIRSLHDDLKRLNFNRQVLADDFEEMRVEFETVTAERDTMSSQIHQLQDTQRAQDGWTQESNEVILSLVMGIAVQRRQHISSTRQYQQMTRRFLSARSTIAVLESKVEQLRRLEEANSELRARIVLLEADIQTAQSTAEATEAEAHSLRTSRTALEAELKGLAEQLSKAQQSGQAVEGLKARVAELEQTAVVMRERAEVAEDQLGALMNKTAAADKVKQDTAELESAFKASEERVVMLQGEVQTLLSQLADNDAAHTEALKKAEQALSDAKEAADTQLTEAWSELAGSKTRVDNMQVELDSALSEVSILRDQLRTQSEDMAKKSDADRAAANEELVDIRLKLTSAEERAESLSKDLEAAVEKGDEMSKASAELQAQVEVLSKDVLRVAELQVELEVKEREVKKGLNLLKFAEAEQKRLSTQLKQVQEKLALSEQAKLAAVASAKAAEMELAVLKAETNRLKEEVAITAGGVASADLEDRIKEMEESLRRKTYEVDEADDRVAEMYKDNDKLKKRNAKLQRQLDAKTKESEKLQGDVEAMKQDTELAANTEANKHIPAAQAPIVPSSTLASARKVAPLPTAAVVGSRIALERPNVFDTSAPIVSLSSSQPGSVKRPRPAEDSRPTVRHMQHPESVSMTQSTPSSDDRRKLAFAPKELNKENLPVAKAVLDVLVKSKSSPDLGWAKPKRDNIFARSEVRPSIFRQPSGEKHE